MKSKRYRTLVVVLAFVALEGWAWKGPMRPGAKATVDRHGQPNIQPTTQLRLAEAYGKLPLSFEINRGQTDSRVKFLSRGSGYSLFLTGNEAVLALRKGSRQSRVEGRKARDSLLLAAHHLSLASSRLQRGTGFFPALVAPPLGADGARLDEQRSPSSGVATDNGPPPVGSGRQGEPQTTDAVLRMHLVGANPNAPIRGMEELPGKSNYFIGSDPQKWRTNVSNYANVKYTNVYPGVDLVYYGNQGQLEYDFVVQPGADPNSIQLAINWGEQVGNGQKAVGGALRVNANGDLVVGTEGGEVIFHKPVVYQPEESRQSPVVSRQLHRTTDEEQLTKDDSERHYIDGRYVLRTDNSIGFQLAHYDRRRPAIIDPTLAYSTYLGGSDVDVGFGIALDAAGNAYVTGATESSNFPTTPGAFQTTFGYGGADAFVTKLSAAGSALVYSTYLGGIGDDVGEGIAVDASGNAYVTGNTDSSDFPTTGGAFQTSFGGGFFDAFVSKLNTTGSALLYSTSLGGSDDDRGSGVAVDASGNAYVTGFTVSCTFPTTPGAFQTTFGGGCSICEDAFVSKLNATGSALVYSTYLGGSYSDFGSGIAIDTSGNIYVTGQTRSSNFPTTPGAFQTTFLGPPTGCVGLCADAFVSKLNATGSALLYSTYLGGSNDDRGSGVAVDASGNACVTGQTASTNLPTTPGAFQATFGGGLYDAFVTKLNAAGSALAYSTYLGGIGEDFGLGIAMDSSGNTYVTGQTASANFPTTPGAFQVTFGGSLDAFVSKFSFGMGILFSSLSGKLELDPDAGSFDLNAGFRLGAGGSINPPTQPVSLTIGTFSVTIPAGSFVRHKPGYAFEGVINGVSLEVLIKFGSTLGSYQVLAEGRGANLNGATNPVTVTLSVGNNMGTTHINAEFQ